MRIAFLSPLSPARSGTADYSEALLPHLAARLEQIDVFVGDEGTSIGFAQENLRVRCWREFEAEHAARRYDVVLYLIGNNPFHLYVYDLALRIPGVVVLHEFNLHYLVAHATVARGDWEGYFREVAYNAGPAALERARLAQAGVQQPDYQRIPMNRRLLDCSQAFIVHSQYMASLLRQASCRLPVRQIHHGVDIVEQDRAVARQKLAEWTGLSLGKSTPVFGVFGFLKPYKRIHESLRALARLRAIVPTVKMVMVGEEHPHYPLRPLVSQLRLDDIVAILGYVPADRFNTCLAATDICINLRWPTAGETSGSLLRALASGKPTLVSDVGAFQELPDDVVIKIPVDEREEDWLFEYMRILVQQPDLAAAIGCRARQFVQQNCLWPQVADRYVEFLEECAGKRPQKEPSDVLPENPVLPLGSASTSASEDELADYIMGFSQGSPQMEGYALTHLNRLVRTLQITPRGTPQDRILEMGCYLQITPALRRYLSYGEIRGAYYGPVGQTHQRSTVSITGEQFSCPIDLFDAERDPFPYPNGYFRTVLCCELIEHLTTDPMHMLAEINRVMALGGYLVLTTPNIVSLRSVRAVLHGYHPGLFPAYIRPSSDGSVDPRHSREYAPREVDSLLAAAGFQVERLETFPYARTTSDATELQAVSQFLKDNHFPSDLRDEMICCLARKIGPVRERWPKELYYWP